jgi:hypothetical protein
MLTGLRAMKSNNFMFEAIADFYAWQAEVPHLLQKLEV